MRARHNVFDFHVFDAGSLLVLFVTHASVSWQRYDSNHGYIADKYHMREGSNRDPICEQGSGSGDTDLDTDRYMILEEKRYQFISGKRGARRKHDLQHPSPHKSVGCYCAHVLGVVTGNPTVVAGRGGHPMEQLESHVFILIPDFFDDKGSQMGQLAIAPHSHRASADGHDPDGVHPQHPDKQSIELEVCSNPSARYGCILAAFLVLFPSIFKPGNIVYTDNVPLHVIDYGTVVRVGSEEKMVKGVYSTRS
ncbi:hypothetical protein BGY98DRAFT_1177566 [Russula aff. rugulosa BPL654]|nr:hypothetical protein BGY98DRAFT_1177566 [Russula aff. rugulosa BPL654]